MKNIIITLIFAIMFTPTAFASEVVNVGTCSVDNDNATSISGDCASYVVNTPGFAQEWIKSVDQHVAEAMQSALDKWRLRNKRAEETVREGNRAAIKRILGR